ncbi:hypothetical protein HN011_012482 [Eciton burchellii]|nr:hypothetical protein HN011_012482 [Eciton burchellii]
MNEIKRILDQTDNAGRISLAGNSKHEESLNRVNLRIGRIKSDSPDLGKPKVRGSEETMWKRDLIRAECEATTEKKRSE